MNDIYVIIGEYDAGGKSHYTWDIYYVFTEDEAKRICDVLGKQKDEDLEVINRLMKSKGNSCSECVCGPEYCKYGCRIQKMITKIENKPQYGTYYGMLSEYLSFSYKKIEEYREEDSK